MTKPNISSERAAHSVRFLAIHDAVSFGPPLKPGIRLLGALLAFDQYRDNMGLLQDPKKALEQVEWYLDHHGDEKFPGALELAAGNLCRQTVEQILFILCFFSRMPRNRYICRDRTLQTAGRLITALDKCDPTTGKTYWELARKRGPRIRKFARYPRTLRAWQRKLNEPSHFSTKFRKVDEAWLRAFVGRVRQWIDDKDKYLIVAAVNELFSQGRIQATLKADPDNTPAVSEKIVVGPGILNGTSEVASSSADLSEERL